MINSLAIIIPTLNEEKYLPKLLTSIAAQDFTGQLQVVVVDGYSSDRTMSVAAGFTASIDDFTIIQTECGISRQRNKGAELAKYDHLLFLDADIILPVDTLSRLMKKHQPSERFIDFALHVPSKPNLGDYLFGGAVFGYIWLAQWIFEPVLIGSFIFTTQASHQKLGGFDEAIAIWEDYDYGQRAIAEGATYYFHLKPFVLASPRRLRKHGRLRLLWEGLTRYFYIKKHGPIRDGESFGYSFGNHPGDE